MSEQTAILPEAKVGALLADYPQLESLVATQAPLFGKLVNPILRQSVTKVATLQQIADAEGLDVQELVSILRTAAGQSVPGSTTGDIAVSPAGAPDWVASGQILSTFDADEYLSRGEHPLAAVTAKVQTLQPGQTVLLKSSFRPAPLVEKMEQQGYHVFCAEQSAGMHLTYITC